jgi:hypothetical protein
MMKANWELFMILPILGLALWYCWKRLILPLFGKRKMACGSSSCNCDVSSH